MAAFDRASGYDFANLWMNMAKIVIALLFLYQNALDTQLGVRVFQDNYYVFHVPVSSEVDGESTEVVTPDDPNFSIDFKPLSLGQPYDRFVVRVEGLSNQLGDSLLASRRDPICSDGNPACVAFSWNQLTGGNKAVLHRASFNLMNLVSNESSLVSGDYQVSFAFEFFRRGNLLDTDDQVTRHNGTLKFMRNEELRFGDVPVVQGRPFPLPRVISERLKKGGGWGSWDAYREVRVLETGSESGWRNGAILQENLDNEHLFPIRRLRPGRTYEQRGHFFDEQNVQVDFTIGFNLLRNEAPRSTYLGPGQSDVHLVRIYYDWHFFEVDQGYFYYNLSRHIIDPDGTTAPIDGRPDVRVREFGNLRPNDLLYRLQRDRATGDWHLRVGGRIEDSLAPGSTHELTVVASDDFQSQNIRIRIER